MKDRLNLTSRTNPFWQIFVNQSKFSTYQGAETMLEDFACKCIHKGLNADDTVMALSEYYSQSIEVAKENVTRAKLIVDKQQNLK